MIKLMQLAQEFEKGLNAQLQNNEIQFKIWADAGEYQKPIREGNVITHYVIGNLRTSSSANEANDLVMGVNGLNLTFKIPIFPPKTNARQTAQRLQKIQNGQYPFLQYITDAINGYFQKAQAITLEDESKEEYSVAFQAGTAVTGNVELAAKYGQSVEYEVYIQVYFILGGTNSKDVKISFDNSPVPYQSVSMSRAPMLERDVKAGTLTSKNIATSTAFAIDIDFPANSDLISQEVDKYLLDGEPNIGHFVNIQWGDKEKLYFMALNTLQTSARGINIAGVTASLMEIIDNPLACGVPEGFQVGRFKLADSQTKTLKFTLSAECNTFITGVGALKRSGAQTVTLTENSFYYNAVEKVFYVYLITDKAVNVSNASATFLIYKGAANA